MNGKSQVSRQELDELTKDMKSFGATDKQIAEQVKELTRSDEEFELLEENVSIWLWFNQVSDCFKWALNVGGAVCLGLDIQAVKFDAEMSGREFTSLEYQGLRLLTKEVTALLNEQSIERE